MGIRRHLWTLILPVALFAASGIPGLAKDSRTVALTHDTVLNGTTLPAGRYLVQWKAHSPRATVEFAHGRKVVFTTECRLEDRSKKYTSSTVLYDTASNGTVTLSEIRFAGSSQVLVFSQ